MKTKLSIWASLCGSVLSLPTQRAALLLALLLVFGPRVQAQQGKTGVGTITAAGTVVNAYTSLTANAVAGTTSLAVANSALTGGAFGGIGLTTGDLVLVIQHQGASITTAIASSAFGTVTAYNSAGRYELSEVRTYPTLQLSL